MEPKKMDWLPNLGTFLGLQAKNNYNFIMILLKPIDRKNQKAEEKNRLHIIWC